MVLESDKATMDVPSTLTGTVVSMIAKEGDKLGTGDQVAVIEVSGGSDSAVQEADPEPQSQAVTETVPPATAPEIKPEPVSFPQSKHQSLWPMGLLKSTQVHQYVFYLESLVLIYLRLLEPAKRTNSEG